MELISLEGKPPKKGRLEMTKKEVGTNKKEIIKIEIENKE